MLLLLNKGGKDSQYKIIRLITRFFEIWDFSKAIGDVVAEGLIVSEKDGAIDVYRMTDNGRIFLQDHMTGLQERLLAEFPAQKEFIDLLF